MANSPEDLSRLVRLRTAREELDTASNSFPGISFLIDLLIELYEIKCAEILDSPQARLLQQRSDQKKGRKSRFLPTSSDALSFMLGFDQELIEGLLNPLLHADIIPNDQLQLPDDEAADWEKFLDEGGSDDDE